MWLDSRTASGSCSRAKLCFQVFPVFQSFAQRLRVGWGWGWKWWGRWFWSGLGPESNLTDVEVLLEAIGLEQIGKFQGSHIATGFPDFALEVTNDFLDLLRPVSEPEQFIPHSFPIKSQTEVLAGQLTVELMSLTDLFRTERNGFHGTVAGV